MRIILPHLTRTVPGRIRGAAKVVLGASIAIQKPGLDSRKVLPNPKFSDQPSISEGYRIRSGNDEMKGSDPLAFSWAETGCDDLWGGLVVKAPTTGIRPSKAESNTDLLGDAILSYGRRYLAADGTGCHINHKGISPLAEHARKTGDKGIRTVGRVELEWLGAVAGRAKGEKDSQ